MEEERLNFLLFGKTGHGKSSTGNTILRQPRFSISDKVTTETKDVAYCVCQFQNYLLKVVDGPELQDTSMNTVDEKIAASEYVPQALGMCYEGVDAFLFVFKFGSRFTMENKTSLEVLIRVFGGDFMKRVIVVVTHGDDFREPMVEQNCDTAFRVWCREQKGVFRELYEKCEGRFVLFNNLETDEETKLAQIQEVVSLAQKLQRRHGRYTIQSYDNARHENKKDVDRLKIRAQKRHTIGPGKITCLILGTVGAVVGCVASPVAPSIRVITVAGSIGLLVWCVPR